MVADIIFGIMGIGLIVLLAFILSKPQKREMTGAEKDAYERKRGEIQAEEDFGRRRY